jgi:ABC-type transport system involved in cytochrome c biogenesis permease subunit
MRPGYDRRVIALTSFIPLVIGWYRGFGRGSLELAGAAFAVVLAVQTVGLVLTSREAGDRYWITVFLVAAGWVACIWIGSRARRMLTPP